MVGGLGKNNENLGCGGKKLKKKGKWGKEKRLRVKNSKIYKWVEGGGK